MRLVSALTDCGVSYVRCCVLGKTPAIGQRFQTWTMRAIYGDLLRESQKYSPAQDSVRPQYFTDELNKYFLKKGIGWQLVEGEVTVRGEKAFEETLTGATNALTESGRPTAAKEISQALHDLSRRPESDLTGALQHALAAVECVMREVTGDQKATLGSLLLDTKALSLPLLTRQWRKSGDLPPSRDDILERGKNRLKKRLSSQCMLLLLWLRT